MHYTVIRTIPEPGVEAPVFATETEADKHAAWLVLEKQIECAVASSSRDVNAKVHPDGRLIWLASANIPGKSAAAG
jgi:hypothetical protein